jgi:D-alanyl-D-alanine carboxypeptidase (penicillin-binding protein 5/6)
MRGLISPSRDICALVLNILVAVALSGVATGAKAQAIQTSIPHAILMDADTGSVLFEKSADDPVVPASTVKVMTAEIVFHEIAAGHIKLDDELPISENAWRYGGAPSRGSSMFAPLNSKAKVEDLIRGLVIVSGNDAAIALAEGVAGSEGAFATLMMKRGSELGLTHSTFTNSWGRDDPEQRVSPRDMTKLANYVIQTYPDLYKYFGEKDFTFNKIKQSNRNPLLTMSIGADGLKTGNINTSGFGLIGSAVQNGQRLILALYGAPDAKSRAEEARKLFLWGFRSFEPKTIFDSGETIADAKVYGGELSSVPLVAKGPVKVLIPRTPGEKLTAKVVYQGPLIAPVAAGSDVARLQVFRGQTQVLDLPLQTAAAVEVGSLPRRALDAGLEYGGDLVRKVIKKP